MEVRLPVALNRIMRRYTVGNQMGQAHCALNAESLAHRGVAHIGVDQQHLAAVFGECSRQIRAQCGLAFGRAGGSHHNHIGHRLIGQHEHHIGAQASNLFCLAGGRAGDNHRRRTGISLIAAQRPQYGSIDNSGNIRIAANTGVQQILDKGNHDAENDTDRKTCRQIELDVG